ncbi:MAG: hypothetical protein M3T56_10360 [Chloroflexota bacterium]|nr:hypothetical protein [Chloroflexota bacterium]
MIARRDELSERLGHRGDERPVAIANDELHRPVAEDHALAKLLDEGAPRRQRCLRPGASEVRDAAHVPLAIPGPRKRGDRALRFGSLAGVLRLGEVAEEVKLFRAREASIDRRATACDVGFAAAHECRDARSSAGVELPA